MSEIHYWKKIFIEIATRAIRQSHFDFQVISLAQNNISLKDLKLLNTGPGIELVPEESVRDNIVTQLLNMGLWKKIQIDGNERSYWTDREIHFKFDRTNSEVSNLYESIFEDKLPVSDRQDLHLYVDLSIQRYEDLEGGGKEKHPPALIELKRLNTKQICLEDNPPYIDGQNTIDQIREINKDVNKLRFIRSCICRGALQKKVEKDNAVIAILTWGVISDHEKEELFRCLKMPNNHSEVRYFPVQWNDERDEIEWCIVVLSEIDHDVFDAMKTGRTSE